MGNSIPIAKPSICIDLKKKRIRIHKAMLHQMRDPDFIQLLVNPSSKGMIIRACDSKDKYAQKVRTYETNGDYCYELYSTDLLQNMMSVTAEWEESRSYRIYGKYNSTIDAAFFSLRDIVSL